MKKLLYLVVFLLSAVSAQNLSQEAVQSIASDGLILFNLETLTRNSADKLYASNAMEGLSGFLAYQQGGLYHCIYWKGQGASRRVVYHYSALSPEKPKFYTLDKAERMLSDYETMLANIKQIAQDSVRENTDYCVTNRGVSLTLHLMEKETIFMFL
ncbi:MAG: hypothetical protein R3B47_00105 [Bacteroidia bacterium]